MWLLGHLVELSDDDVIKDRMNLFMTSDKNDYDVTVKAIETSLDVVVNVCVWVCVRVLVFSIRSWIGSLVNFCIARAAIGSTICTAISTSIGCRVSRRIHYIYGLGVTTKALFSVWKSSEHGDAALNVVAGHNQKTNRQDKPA